MAASRKCQRCTRRWPTRFDKCFLCGDDTILSGCTPIPEEEVRGYLRAVEELCHDIERAEADAGRRSRNGAPWTVVDVLLEFPPVDDWGIPR